MFLLTDQGLEVLWFKVMRSRNFRSMKFPQIWYKDSFRVADMNFNKKRRGHRGRLVTMVTRISWFILHSILHFSDHNLKNVSQIYLLVA